MNILLILYELSKLLTICSTDCGPPGHQSITEVHRFKRRYQEGDVIYYSCKQGYHRIFDNTNWRECVRGRWSGEATSTRCAINIDLHSDFSRLKYNNFNISYLDEEGGSNHTEISNLSQILTDSDDALLAYRNRFIKCFPLNESKHIQFKIIFSHPTRISAMDLFYSNRNQTQNSSGYSPRIEGFINSYRNCSQYSVISSNAQRLVYFLCDVMKKEDYKEEKNNLPNSVTFEFKSDDLFQIGICGVNLYQIPDECGQPDLPLYTSGDMIMNRNSSSFSYKSIDDDRYKIIGNNKYECVGDAKWFPTSPLIVQPIKSCDMPDLSINHSDYSIEVSKFDFFNETMVASIDTRLIYTCLDKSINKTDERNQTNSDEHEFASRKLSSKARQFIQHCDENGQWIGPSPDCVDEKNESYVLIIRLISLVTSFALISIGLFIFGAYFIFKKKKNASVKIREKMNESLKEDDDDVLQRKNNDSNGMENDINMTNIYDVIQDANDYDELDSPSYDNNDQISYEVINETSCSVKNDDDEYQEVWS